MSSKIPSAEETAALGREFVAALVAADPAVFRKLFAPSARIRLVPRSLNAPESSFEEFLHMQKTARTVFTNPKIELINLNASPGNVWIHASATADLITGESYAGEYVFMLAVEDGQFTSLVEFVDSVAVKPLMTLIMEKLASAKPE